EAVPIIVKVIIDGDELTVDFTDMAPQAKGPINSGYYGGGQTIARGPVKYLIGAGEVANARKFRPIKIVFSQGKRDQPGRDRALVHVSNPVPDRDRRGDQGARTRAA